MVSTSTESPAALQGAVLALGVAAVAVGDVVQHLFDRTAALGRAAARPLIVIGDQKHLEGRVWADDGADVPALGDVRAPARSGRAGEYHRFADAGVDGDARGEG